MSTTAKLHDGGAEGASLARVTEAPGPVPTYYEIRDGGGGVAQLTMAELDEIAIAYLSWRLRGRRSL
ncbi:MAG TPA: hypothetical protein VI670_27765 [Thermoanaerobaculia bacterium]|jgi:hypothetical protein